MSIPLKGEFSPNRWRSSVHIMLQKQQGFPHVDRLRSIQLLDPEYNSLLKMKVIHKAMRRNYSNSALGGDMYGGRPKMSTHNSLMSQTLSYDIQSQLLKTGTLINIDASKCFDKIYPNLANIALQRIGIHPSLAILFSETSKKMTHQITTHQGVMPPTLTAPDNSCYSGVGQGNAASGIAWLALESLILKAL